MSLFGVTNRVTQSLFGVTKSVSLWCPAGSFTQSLFVECPVFARASLYCWWYLQHGGSVSKRFLFEFEKYEEKMSATWGESISTGEFDDGMKR